MLEWKWRPDGGAALWRWNTLKHAQITPDVPLHTYGSSSAHYTKQPTAFCSITSCRKHEMHKRSKICLCHKGNKQICTPVYVSSRWKWCISSLCKNTLSTLTFSAKGFIRSLSALVSNDLQFVFNVICTVCGWETFWKTAWN